MTDFKIGDVVWVRAKVWDRSRHPDRLKLEVGNGEVIAGESDCKPYSDPDLKQAIREVLLGDEFMKAFAAAWVKTPLPMGEFAFCEPQEPGELCEPKINNSILPELKSARFDLAERTLKAIWQTNDGGNQ